MIRRTMDKIVGRFLKWVLADPSRPRIVFGGCIVILFGTIFIPPIGNAFFVEPNPTESTVNTETAATQSPGQANGDTTARALPTASTTETKNEIAAETAGVKGDSDIALAEAEATQTADMFTSSFLLTEGQTIEQWLATLRPITTDRFYARLEDGTATPTTNATASEVINVSLFASSATVRIGLTDGTKIRVFLVYEDSWLVQKAAFEDAE